MKYASALAALACALALVLRSEGVYAQPRKVELVAVVHAQNDIDSISEGTLGNIYLGRQRTWSGGTAVEPYMRPSRSPAGFAFFREVLAMTPARFRYHWQTLQLSGRGTIPKSLGSLRAVLSRVAGDRGAITYVSEAEAERLAPYVKRGLIRIVPIR